jgi:hypothetical protein
MQTIQIHVEDMRQLFNSMDPTPFNKRDLDPAAESFIVDWARDLPREVPLSLQIHSDRARMDDHERDVVRESICRFFENRVLATRRQLRSLFQRGRISLLIGLAFLAASLATSELLAQLRDPSALEQILRETLSIGGWVAMWRPLEIFLYDWWPLTADLKLMARLRDMPVDIQCSAKAD